MEWIKKKEFKLLYHGVFYRIAYNHYLQVQKLANIPVIEEAIRDSNDLIQIQQFSLVAVIFSALSLEAFINDYALRLSRNYLENYLDKLNPVSKWVVIPRLVTGKQIDTSSQAFEHLKKLFVLRNKLVHYKPITGKISELLNNKSWIRVKTVKESIESVKEAMKTLKELDPSVDIDWLEDAKTNPYA